MEASTRSHRIRFGKFEVDPESGELFKDSRRVRLQGQPIQVLLLLLEKPGRLVTREEFQQRLWPKDTSVDSDYGLNAAIKRLRESLGDSADEPLYIETLPRRGYRFIFPVEGVAADTRGLPQTPSPSLILRLWHAMTQSPGSPGWTEDHTPTPVHAQTPAVTAPEPAETHKEETEAEKQLLAEGHRLGPYEILSLLGKGGMGEVYLARDTRLDRQVEIKVLPDGLTRDPERLAHFEREAKLLASLNHPNIAAIYGLEEVGARRFFVMELVEGETLAERLSAGPLSIEESLRVCCQIAEGVEAAHEKGIINWGLKPANIKITPEDMVKILDLGLARTFGNEDPDRPKSPTITDEINHPIIVGSEAYISPEQASGKPTDKRTDIWAFGCVLFECLTGRRAFEGEAASETLAEVLKDGPDSQTLPATTPRKVKDLLRRCLRKDPRERLHDIADARIEINEQIALSEEAVRVTRRLTPGWLITACSSMLIIGALIGLKVMKNFTSTISQPVVRSPIKLEPGYWLDGIRYPAPWGLDQPTRTAMAISRDSRFIIYSAISKNSGPQPKPRLSEIAGRPGEAKPQLYLRRTDQLGAKPIPGTEGGINPFLSPDDRWMGFWADRKLMKVPIGGGVPVHLCDGGSVPMGASWGPDNSIVFSSLHAASSGLSRVPADGGKVEALTMPDMTRDESSHRLPHWLPDGGSVLFTIMREWSDLRPRVALFELKTRKWRVLLEDAADARYVPTGHLVFLRQGTLMAVPFDLDRHEVSGQPVPTISNLMQALNISHAEHNTSAGQFSISDSGWLVYVVGGIMPDQENSLLWVDQKGNVQPAVPFRSPFFGPRLSPDGQRLAYTTHGKESHVWVYDLNRGTASPLTREGKAVFVSWTPDGKRVVFGWWMLGQPNLYWQPIDGSLSMERLTMSDNYQATASFLPDGGTLVFAEADPDTSDDIILLDMRLRRVIPYIKSRATEWCPELSPDGRWLAYVSDDSGRDEVYVRPFPGPGGKWQISSEGGQEPLWARNGKQLFYRSNDVQQVWVVDIRTDGGFAAGKPRFLFETPNFGGGIPVRGWDISLDNRRFLMVRLEQKPRPVTEMILVQNWFEELKRLCPTK